MSVYAKIVMPPQMTIRMHASAQFNSQYAWGGGGGRGAATCGADQTDGNDSVRAVCPDAAAVDDPVEGRDLCEFGLLCGAAETCDALLRCFRGCSGRGAGRGRAGEGVRAGGGEAGGVCDGAGRGHCAGCAGCVGGGGVWC